MTAIVRYLALGFSLAAALACKKKPLFVSTTAYILGPQSQITVISAKEQSEIDPRVLNASVLISTRLSEDEVKFCSGTLIPSDQPGGNLRVLANHHCFAEVDSEGLATAELLPEACTQTKVYLGFLAGQSQSSSIVDCLPGSLRTSLDGDLSVFRLASQLPPQFQPLTIADKDFKVAGRRALIVHYPDIKSAKAAAPDGGPKLPLAQVTKDNCKVIGNFPIAHWQFDRSVPFSVKHTCDLTHGSSGSGLVDLSTSQLIGVNWGGIKINDNGNNEVVNVATGLGFLHAFLNYNTAAIEQEAAQSLASAAAIESSKAKSGGVLQSTGVTKVLGCGVIASGGHAPATSSLPSEASSLYILFWALPLLPILAHCRRRDHTSRKGASALSKQLAVVAILGLGLSSAVPAAASQNQANWATAYLMDAVFLSEYVSVSDRDRAAAMVSNSHDRPMHSAEWMRAKFALSALKSKDFHLPLESALAERVAIDPAARAHAATAAELEVSQPSSVGKIAASFTGTNWAEKWQSLSAAYADTLPDCKAHTATVTAVLDQCGKTPAPATSPSQTAMLAKLGGLAKAERECLLVAIARDQAALPAPQIPEAPQTSCPTATLMQLLIATQAASGDQGELNIKASAIYAGRMVAEAKFSDALSTLLTMVEKDDRYRLPYELVQRAYAWRQRGSGQVAIQGL